MAKTYPMMNTPKLGFGFMRLPTTGDGDSKIDIEEVKKMVDLYMERGFTYYDTAFLYHGGESEIAVREAVTKRYPRDKFQVTTKMPMWNIKGPEDYEKTFKTQLEKTGLDFFDIYFLHGIGEERLELIDSTGGWDFLKSLKERGLAKHIGFSFHSTASCLNKILDAHPEIDVVQIQLNYYDWDNPDVQSKECYEACINHGVGVIFMEPVRGGSLAAMPDEITKLMKDYNPNDSVASWAIRFCGSLEGVVTVLSGMSTLEQVDDNTKTMMNFKPLNDEERSVLNEVVAALKAIPTVPCTGCAYCMDECPQKINTPAIIKALNEYRTFRSLANVKRRYEMTTGRGGKASDCVDCRNCENHCPQHLPVVDILKECADLFE